MIPDRKERRFFTYAPGDKVYVIDRWHDGGKETSHVVIAKEEIQEVSIQVTKDKEELVEYWFKYWGCPVASSDVDADFDVLVRKMKKEWEQKED